MELTAPAYWINETFAEFDEAVAIAVHRLYDVAGGFFTPFFKVFAAIGKWGLFLILLSLILTYMKPTRRFGTAMLLSLAIGLLFTNLFLKIYVSRPRPYTDENHIIYQYWLTMGRHMESDKSFPSGHTTAAFACMTPVFLLGNKKLKIAALSFAVLMALSRIYLGVHYPSDVVGGVLVGIPAGILATLIARKLPQEWYEWELKKQEKYAGKHEIHR